MYEGFSRESYRFAWYPPIKFSKWKPMVFEYCTFNQVSDTLYLYGGKDFSRNNLVGAYNRKSKKWRAIICQNVFPPHGRISHSCIVYQKKLYIFGGEK
jgi:hypothetical protein